MKNQDQTIKTLKDGKAVSVKVSAPTWEDAYDEYVVEVLESIANEQIDFEKLIIFDQSGAVQKTFEPEFFSRGDIQD